MPDIIKETAYILRTCDAEMRSWEGFQWPESGPVEAPDWEPTDECGNGLHGLLWGEGDGSLLDWKVDARWIVARVEEYIDLGDKVKFPRAEVVFVGDRKAATDKIIELGARGPVVGAIVCAGDYGTASAGDYGTASAGRCGTASAGDGGTASAGDYGTASAGYMGTASAGRCGTASAGDLGTASAGYKGTASAGYRGTASAGRCGTASAGDGGTASAGALGTASVSDGGTASAGDGGIASAGEDGAASAGDYGTARAGDRGTASAGYGGTASAGDRGTVMISWFDGNRSRIAVGYVGEGGIEPNTPYRVENGQFVKVEK